MTTELVILLSFVVLIMAAITGSLPSSFENSRGYLSGRLERHIETGTGFTRAGEISWTKPPAGRN